MNDKVKPTNVIADLIALIRSHPTENRLQRFLEQFPWLVSGNHYPSPSFVISQFPLGPDYRADFASFWHNSGGNFLELVEIERPDFPVFRADDEFTAGFNHAVQQIADWAHKCTKSA